MYIVTGGAGFIGSVLIQRLNSAGINDILVVDNLGTGTDGENIAVSNPSASEKWKNLLGKKFSDYIHKDDFLMLLLEEKLGLKPTAVIHLGARASTTETNAEFMLANNYRYTQLLAKWCLNNNARFIYASSAATYGDGALGFADDDEITPSLKPLNIYGFSKHLFDLWALQTGASKKIAGLKFFNVYGPNELHKGEMRSVVAKSFEQISTSGKVKLFKSNRSEYKDGEQLRDFVYVKDAVEVIVWLAQNPKVNGLYNVGSGKARSWNDLVGSVFAAMKKQPTIEFIDLPQELRDKYQYFTEAKIEKLGRAGCPVKFRSLEDGVKDYVQQYLLKGLSC